jgi:hypothetical protein
MQQPTCEICGDPTDATICRRETRSLAGYLSEVIKLDLAVEVQTSIARLAQHGHRGGFSPQSVEEDLDEDLGDERRRLPLMAHGWAARLERPKRGALVSTALPYLPGKERAAHGAINAITTAARDICETRGIQVPMPGLMVGPLCRAGWGCKHETCAIIRARIIDHPAARAATFLLTQLDWIRWHADAVAYVEELSAAAAILRRCVDTPPKMVIVGMCDCSKYLYAYEDQAVATCKECGSQWEVAASRKILEEALVDRLCTAAEAAVLLMKFEMTSNRDRSRKNIVMWAQRGLITAHGEVHGSPTYRLGDIIDRASRGVAA